MKKSTSIFIIGLVSLFVYSCRVTNALFQEREKSNTLENTINDMDQEIDSYRIRLNDSVAVYAARVEALNMTINNIEDKYKKLLKDNSLKAKDINTVTEVKTVIHSVEKVPVEVDTFGGLKAVYDDNFAKISVEIDSTREATIDYTISDSITVINYQKKHKLLFGLIKWKENVRTVVMSSNPKSIIKGVTSVNNIEQ